ncbi:MAG: hypothetical protein ACTSRU_16115 [Candidatus Hodarchaeales archaeon]
MKKIKFRIPTWEESHQFMDNVATIHGATVENRDADQVITTSSFELRSHPDDRGFAYITCKIYDEQVESALENLFSKYTG